MVIDRNAGAMSEAMERGATLASKLRLRAGLARAERALQVSRIGVGRVAIASPRVLTRGLGIKAAPEARVDHLQETASNRPATLMDELVKANGGRGETSRAGALGEQLHPKDAERFKRMAVSSEGASKLRVKLFDSTAYAASPGQSIVSGSDRRGAGEHLQAAAESRTDAGSKGTSIAAQVTGCKTVCSSTSARGLNAAPTALRPTAAASARGRASPAQASVASGAGTGQMGKVFEVPISARAPSALMIETRPSAPAAMAPPASAATYAPGERTWQMGSSMGSTTEPAKTDPRQTPGAENGATASGPSGGDVYLDGTLMGRWVARNLATQAARPASGSAVFDPRRGVFPTGAMIGG